MESLEGFVLTLLTQLVIIIVAAQVGGWLFRFWGQPKVVGEILAGLILGPSCLGMFFPDLLDNIFPASGDLQLRVLGQIGLVLLMFEVGLAFDFSHLTSVRGTSIAVASAGILLPFSLGMLLAYLMAPAVASDVDTLPFALFVATAMSITAIPILGRIMIDLQMETTPIGVLTISAAAIDDAIGWIVLAVISGIVTGGFVVSSTLWQLGYLTIFITASFLIIRPLADRFASRMPWSDPDRAPTMMAVLITGVFGFAIITNMIGVFSVFGPFVLGACLSHRTEIASFYRRAASPLVTAFLLPVFFTFTGLRTDIGSLDLSGWLWCLAIFLVACAGKLVGCGLATKLAGYSWQDSTVVALMMNTRALMGLVAINVGRDLGAIPDSVFSMLVVMAIGTTIMTVPLLKLVGVKRSTNETELQCESL
ncbi:cation:proton antiporter [Aporhodopirellula aestuarii]|uniref:Cation:proton antiporter n=1 Tax=Aporhodopirellula aestuarii TaxID=2950107 RepID=A0ABT0U5G5_9BACT|nr:cation:proton antiporter [Aporhodopirellula aestuarii]MCM2371800.1 cation:proton antiporter [Aporhodopirellula aestuarii]